MGELFSFNLFYSRKKSIPASLLNRELRLCATTLLKVLDRAASFQNRIASLIRQPMYKKVGYTKGANQIVICKECYVDGVREIMMKPLPTSDNEVRMRTKKKYMRNRSDHRGIKLVI